jgi:hypothetical protein
VDEDPEGSLGNIVPRVLANVVGSQRENLHVVITETLQLLVEGRLENSFEKVKCLSNTRTTAPVENDACISALSLSLSLILSLPPSLPFFLSSLSLPPPLLSLSLSPFLLYFLSLPLSLVFSLSLFLLTLSCCKGAWLR